MSSFLNHNIWSSSCRSWEEKEVVDELMGGTFEMGVVNFGGGVVLFGSFECVAV